MSELKTLKRIYDLLKTNFLRRKVLSTAELLGIRKDVLRMDTNNYCNIRCIMCDRRSTSGEKHSMSLESFIALMNRMAPGIRRLYLSCACEPLAMPYFAEYLKYAKSQGIPFVSFCTNGLALHQDVIEKIVDCGTDEIIISFNGFTKADYHRIMHGSDYDKVCQNLTALNAYKRQCRRELPHIRLNTLLLKSNLYHLAELKEFVKEYQISTVQFREVQYYVNQNDPAAVKKELLSGLSRREYGELMEKLKKMAALLRTQGKEVLLPLAVENYRAAAPAHVTAKPGRLLSGDGLAAEKFRLLGNVSRAKKHRLSDNALRVKKHRPGTKSSCPVPCFSYWIDWEGNVRVCGYDEKGVIGNVLQDDFRLLKERRKQFQKLALRGECSRELCTMNIETSTIR